MSLPTQARGTHTMLATPTLGQWRSFYPDGPGPFAVTIRCQDGRFPRRTDVARSKTNAGLKNA
jgi:hypothetical protein